MKKDGKYRFSLQFPAETEEQIRVGELLERAGNRKSALVVEALNAYMVSRPEILDHTEKLTIQTTSNYTPEQLEQIVRRIVEERMTQQGVPLPATAMTEAVGVEDDIAQMLDNLDFFQ